MKFRLEAIVELDDTLCDINDAGEREWLWRRMAADGFDPLVLHCNYAGDEIGTVVFPRTAAERDDAQEGK